MMSIITRYVLIPIIVVFIIYDIISRIDSFGKPRVFHRFFSNINQAVTIKSFLFGYHFSEFIPGEVSSYDDYKAVLSRLVKEDLDPVVEALKSSKYSGMKLGIRTNKFVIDYLVSQGLTVEKVSEKSDYKKQFIERFLYVGLIGSLRYLKFTLKHLDKRVNVYSVLVYNK